LTALLALTTAAPAARADDLSDLQGLLSQPVVTTASKSAETATTAPATSTTITAEDMRIFGIHTIAEALDFLSLGVVTSNPLDSPDVGARGVGLPNDLGDHFLLLVNGHAVNEPLFGTARFDQGAGIPMEMIDHIEVILGPGSVLYGSSAMLGVINVVTKRAKDWKGIHVVGEGAMSRSAEVGGGSTFAPTNLRGGVGAGYEFSLFGTASELTAMADYSVQNGPNFFFAPQTGWYDPYAGLPYKFSATGPANGSWGGVSNGTYSSKVPAAQLRFISGNLEINLHASMYDRSVPYRSTFTHPYNDFDNPGYELDRGAWFDLKYRMPLSSIVQLTTRLYGDTFDYQNFANTSQGDVCRFYDVPTCQFHFVGASRWAGVELQSSFDWLKDASLVTLAGVDERVRLVQSKTDTLNLATGLPLRESFGVIDAHDETLGAYVQQTWQPTRWLGLNGGARVDSETRYTGVVSPRLAASAKVWKGGTLKGIYAEAFRAPSWFETNYSNPSQELSQGLTPEHVRSVEGTFEQRVFGQTLLLGVFRSWWTNMVELHVLTPQEVAQAAAQGLINTFEGSYFTQYRNVSSIDNYGFNASLSGASRDGSLRYGVNLTAAVARRTDPCATTVGMTCMPGTTAVFVTPSVFGNARVSYDIPGDWPTLAVASQFMGQRLADRAFEGDFSPTPYAPPQLTLRGTITGPVPPLKQLSYRLFINYSFASTGPYAVGPGYPPVGFTLPGAASVGPAELVPVNQLQAGIGLQYDFR
jgi:outer membrane receptor protein involved in Fe transport